MRTIGIFAMLALLVGVPAALAQNDTGEDDRDVVVDPPDRVDVDVTDNDGDAEESTVAGWSTTTVLVVVVVAVLLVALIAVAAGRDRW